MSRINDFVEWLRHEEGSAYVWGAEGHTVKDGAVYLDGRLIRSDWRKWIKEREESEKNAARATGFIEARLASGQKSVTCYDCSGLVMRYLRGIKGYMKNDLSARALQLIAEPIERSELSPGDLVFRHNGQKVHHVGVYMGGGTAIEACGRDAGVVIRDLAAGGAAYWNRYGMLPVLYEADGDGEASQYAYCAGGSVNVRAGRGTEHRVLAVAHRGDRLLAKSCENGWCAVAADIDGRLVTGFMSGKYIEYKKGE